MMDSLYLLQFACFVFMIVTAAFVGLSRLHTRWVNRRYEKARWMIFTALLGLAGQYALQMQAGFRAESDDLGAVVNMLIYTPCFMLITDGIYTIEATYSRRDKIMLIYGFVYATIIAAFGAGYVLHGSYHIGAWLYVMLALFVLGIVCGIGTIMREMTKRRKMLETMAGTDLLPYTRQSHASLFILFSTVLFIPAAILSSTLLYVIGPVMLLALLFFIITFISLGNNYTPTDELLVKEAESFANSKSDEKPSAAASPCQSQVQNDPVTAVAPTSVAHRMLSDERVEQIRGKLEAWCAEKGYKDSSVNMLTLAQSLHIPKGDLTLYFDQCQHSTFRIWLSNIRFQAAKAMMLEFPDYSNDVISAECGFSARTQLYRIFKTKEGCTPTVWRKNLMK